MKFLVARPNLAVKDIEASVRFYRDAQLEHARQHDGAHGLPLRAGRVMAA